MLFSENYSEILFPFDDCEITDMIFELKSAPPQVHKGIKYMRRKQSNYSTKVRLQYLAEKIFEPPLITKSGPCYN